MMVRFATLCDTCGKRSAEWEQWPRCRACDEHACIDHQTPLTLHEADLDSPATCLCYRCAKAENED